MKFTVSKQEKKGKAAENDKKSYSKIEKINLYIIYLF